MVRRALSSHSPICLFSYCHLRTLMLLAEENNVRLPSIRISFATNMEAFAVLMELSSREFMYEGQKLSVDYLYLGQIEMPEKTAVHVSSFVGSVYQLRSSFGKLPGFKGALIGQSCLICLPPSPYPRLAYTVFELGFCVRREPNRG